MWFFSTLFLVLALTGFSFEGGVSVKKTLGEPAKICMEAKAQCKITPARVAAAVVMAGAAAEVAESSEPPKIIGQLGRIIRVSRPGGDGASSASSLSSSIRNMTVRAMHAWSLICSGVP